MKDTALVIHLLPLAKSLRNNDFPLQVRQKNTHNHKYAKKTLPGLAVQLLTFLNTVGFFFFSMESSEDMGLL